MISLVALLKIRASLFLFILNILFYSSSSYITYKDVSK